MVHGYTVAVESAFYAVVRRQREEFRAAGLLQHLPHWLWKRGHWQRDDHLLKDKAPKLTPKASRARYQGLQEALADQQSSTSVPLCYRAAVPQLCHSKSTLITR